MEGRRAFGGKEEHVRDATAIYISSKKKVNPLYIRLGMTVFPRLVMIMKEHEKTGPCSVRGEW